MKNAHQMRNLFIVFSLVLVGVFCNIKNSDAQVFNAYNLPVDTTVSTQTLSTTTQQDSIFVEQLLGIGWSGDLDYIGFKYTLDSSVTASQISNWQLRAKLYSCATPFVETDVVSEWADYFRYSCSSGAGTVEFDQDYLTRGYLSNSAVGAWETVVLVNTSSSTVTFDSSKYYKLVYGLYNGFSSPAIPLIRFTGAYDPYQFPSNQGNDMWSRVYATAKTVTLGRNGSLYLNGIRGNYFSFQGNYQTPSENEPYVYSVYPEHGSTTYNDATTTVPVWFQFSYDSGSHNLDFWEIQVKNVASTTTGGWSYVFSDRAEFENNFDAGTVATSTDIAVGEYSVSVYICEDGVGCWSGEPGHYFAVGGLGGRELSCATGNLLIDYPCAAFRAAGKALFVPSDSNVQALYTSWLSIKNKSPFDVFAQIYESIDEFSTTTSTSTAFASISQIKTASPVFSSFLDYIRIFIGSAVWISVSVLLYKTIPHLV